MQKANEKVDIEVLKNKNLFKQFLYTDCFEKKQHISF